MGDTPGSLLDLHIAVLLRALVPYRRLSYEEGLFYAEQQASIFLKLVSVLEPPVAIEKTVTEVGLAAQIEDDPMQRTPGQSKLDQTTGNWVITLNLNQGSADRSFVVAHEIKHILDHGFGATLYRPVDVMTTQQRKEHVADYFATCLLMPRLWVERYWRSGSQSVDVMADRFDVSSGRMWLRLEALGLLDEGGCDDL
jgi:IrrE N-terminal-like domain